MPPRRSPLEITNRKSVRNRLAALEMYKVKTEIVIDYLIEATRDAVVCSPATELVKRHVFILFYLFLFFAPDIPLKHSPDGTVNVIFYRSPYTSENKKKLFRLHDSETERK